ncbi:MAG: hypothetical protein IJ003_03675 [Candidatus Gastranaerophilales bacterium]|nr:hypothetical protein [Candidatus Gastranaerophilales bacterium]
MSENMVSAIIVVIVIGVILYQVFSSKQKEESTPKNVVSDKLQALFDMSPNDFATKILASKIGDFSSPITKHLNLPESTVKEVIHSAPKYMFEFSMLILYFAYAVSKSRNKEISYSNLLNFATKSAISGMGMLAFGIDKRIYDNFEPVFKNRMELYNNKSNSQIKNILCNLCFEEIKEGKPVIKKEVTDNTISGMPLFIDHLNNVFAGNELYVFSELVFMYIDHNRKLFETSEEDTSNESEHIETLMYDIDRPEPSQFFVDTRKLVGNWLQQRMNQIDGTRWIKGYLTYPAFEHLSFSYKNQIFCVVVDIIDENTKESCLPEETKSLLINECKKNNLIPCLYKVLVDNPKNPAYNTLKQYSDGWNLFDARTNEPVIPERLGTDDFVEMSEWELNDFAIQIVRDYITDNLKLKILSYQNIVGVDPQLWFMDDNRKKNYVIVRYTMYPNKDVKMPNNISGIQNKCKGYDGFFASVAFCSKGENPSMLYRGQESYISFDGLKKLEPLKEIPTLPLEEFALKISAKVANTFIKFNLKNLTEDERLDYLYMYSTELLLCIYSNLIVERNTSANENNLFPIFLAYLEKMTPPNHRNLIDWTNVVMSRCKIYRQMVNLDKDTYSLYFTKLCQHEIINGTIYTYESIENIPTTSYDSKLNRFYEEITKTNIIYDIKNKLKSYLS